MRTKENDEVLRKFDSNDIHTLSYSQLVNPFLRFRGIRQIEKYGAELTQNLLQLTACYIMFDLDEFTEYKTVDFSMLIYVNNLSTRRNSWSDFIRDFTDFAKNRFFRSYSLVQMWTNRSQLFIVNSISGLPSPTNTVLDVTTFSFDDGLDWYYCNYRNCRKQNTLKCNSHIYFGHCSN